MIKMSQSAREKLHSYCKKRISKDFAVAKQCLWVINVIYVSIATLFDGHVDANFKVVL